METPVNIYKKKIYFVIIYLNTLTKNKMELHYKINGSICTDIKFLLIRLVLHASGISFLRIILQYIEYAKYIRLTTKLN